MARIVRVAACQMGPVQRADSRPATLARLLAMLEEAAAKGATLAVFPELALTTFFPRWPIEDEAELLSYFEAEMPNPNVQTLFDRAKALGVGFYLGYAELARDAFDDGPGGNGAVRRRGYNTSILVSPEGEIIGKYRKVHLPGSARPEVPAAREALLRLWRPRLPRLPHGPLAGGRHHGDAHLQRPPLARGLAVAGAAGGGDGAARL